MEERSTSLAFQEAKSLHQQNLSGLILAPKDYFLGPVFAAAPHKGPREVTVGEKKYLVGGFCPLPVNFDPPALDVRHARAVFSLLSFRKRDEANGTRLIRFSFNEFCKRYARSNGGRYSREISRILGDLMYSFIRVTDLKTKVSHEYRIIEHVDIERRPIRRRDSASANDPQMEMWFNGCTLSPEFYGLLNHIAELQHLDLDVFTSISSPLAQAIYLYIPSRAYHHSEDDPFEITLTNLLRQVSARIPEHKSRRKEVFTKNRTSILKQLDGLATLSGRFRVKLAETADQSEWKLQAWVEEYRRKPKIDENSKVVKAYLASGRSRESLNQLYADIPDLSDYEFELLSLGKIEIDKNLRFFQLAKGILKSSLFQTILSEAKGEELEGRKAKKSPSARLIHRLMEAIKAPVPSRLKDLDN